MIEDSYRLTVRLLVTGTGTWTTKLLWLATSVVGNEQSTVVRDESLLQLVLAVLIDVLLVVGNLHFCVSSLMLHVCYGEAISLARSCGCGGRVPTCGGSVGHTMLLAIA